MVSTGQLFLLSIVAWCCLHLALDFYKSFHAPRCPPGAPDEACYWPLFSLEEEVDLFVYLTTKERLRWWRREALEDPHTVLLWNMSGLRFGAEASARDIPVPLSLPQFQPVRRNESTLYAHCYLVRSGRRLEDVLQAAARSPDPGPAAGALGTDGVHASAALTRRLPHVPLAERKNLLQKLNGSEAQAGDPSVDDPDAPVELPPVFRTVPGLGRIAIYPWEMLQWVGVSCAVTTFLSPAPIIAALRHFLLAAAAALVDSSMEQRALYDELLRERQRRLNIRAQEYAKSAKSPVPHLVPIVQISLGAESEVYNARFPPPLLYMEMVFDDSQPMPVGQRDRRYTIVDDPPRRRYVPPLSIDHTGIQQRQWRVLDKNTSKEDPVVPITVAVQGMMRYSVVETMKQSIEMYMRFGVTERDLQDLKDFLFRYPLHIMIIMQVIGFLQTILTTLAFKNDITFFRGRDDYTGLSSRSLATDTVQEIIIFFYLYDYEDISRILLYQVGVSALISAWKYVRVARLGVEWHYFLPWITHNRGSAKSSQESITEDIDAKGMRYLKLVLYPLSGMWGMYNLYHYHYKSWWSWLISSLADFAYTFSFINMMPQIFINYKLKSVAHMPWRVLMYKFFHTFIDDVFAFFIMTDYMTKKHRYMTLRDDIVFFIFLYQRYIYQVDHSRPDEFGFVYSEAKALDAALEAVDGEEREAVDRALPQKELEPAVQPGGPSEIAAVSGDATVTNGAPKVPEGIASAVKGDEKPTGSTENEGASLDRRSAPDVDTDPSREGREEATRSTSTSDGVEPHSDSPSRSP